MNKTKTAVGRNRKANRCRRNGITGQRGNGASPIGKQLREATRNWRNPKNEFDPVIQRYFDLYEFAPIAYVAFDRSGRVQDLNLAATNVLDRRREQLMGSPFSLCVLAADLDLFLRHLTRCRADERRVETNLRLKRHDGAQLSVVLSSTPTTSIVRDGARLFQTAIVDLTERERIEADALRLAAIVQSSHDAIVAKDLNGIITDWNQSAERIFGYNAEQIIGKSILTLIPEGRKEEETEILRKIRRGESIEHYQTVRQCKDRRLIDVSLTISPIKDRAGQIIGVSKIARDITKLKQTESRLAEQARLLDLSNDAIIVRDVKDRVIYWNRGATEVYGYEPEEAAGKITHKLLRTEHPESIKAIRKKLERDGRWAGELVHTRKDGTKITVASRWSLDRDDRGRPTSVLETNNDISRRKQAERELRRSKQLLELLVRKRTEALRSANSELENEITRRKGLEGQILEISDREQQRLGQELHDGLCQQLTAIGFLARATALRLKDHRVVQVEDLEKIVQLINGSVNDARKIAYDLHKEEIDAASLEDALRDLTERKIWNTRCRFQCDGDLGIDDDRVASELFRILREGVINANKHAQAKEIVLEAGRTKREVVFTVTDNGVGLNGFEKKEGKGLGFHIMQYRAQSIGARLELESPRRGGTRLAVYLPIKK